MRTISYNRPRRFIQAFFMLPSFLLLGCGDGEGGGPAEPSAPNPVPVLNALSPDSLHQVDGSAELSLLGNGFVQGSRVLWNGLERTPTFVNDRTLRLSFDPENLESLEEAQVAVRNPAPGGGAEPGPRRRQLRGSDPASGASPDLQRGGALLSRAV